MKSLVISPKFVLPETNNANIPSELGIEYVYEIIMKNDDQKANPIYATIREVRENVNSAVIYPNILFYTDGFGYVTNDHDGYNLADIQSITPKYLFHDTVKNNNPLDPDSCIEITIINHRSKTPYRIRVDSESLVCVSIRDINPKTNLQYSRSIYGYIKDIVGSKLKITALCNERSIFSVKDLEIESSKVRGIYDSVFTFNEYYSKEDRAAMKASRSKVSTKSKDNTPE